MTNYVEWFRYQLKASAAGFEWAFLNLPPSFLEQPPPEPQYLGTWSPTRHVWHVTEYERCLAIPSMHCWIGLSNDIVWHDDDQAWAQVQARQPEKLIAHFQQVRQQQIELLDHLVNIDWSAPRQTPFGQKPLLWIVTKTFQHTWEHGDTLLRMGLWWEHILGEIARAKKE